MTLLEAVKATQNAVARGERCNYYGNRGANLVSSYCQSRATHDFGRRIRVTGLPYQVRFACDEHASRLNFYRVCTRLGHTHQAIA